MRKLITIALCLFISVAIAKPLDEVRWQALPGTVTLTFDDGPHPVYTPQVLEILRKNGIKATFFVMGWAAKKYPDLIKQMVREGHAVAHHTNSHPKLTQIGQKQLRHEIVMPKEAVRDIIGKPPVCVRPPFGMGNDRVKKFIAKQGMVMVPMGFNSFDYERRGVKKLTDWVVKNARSKQVFLLHDGPKARQQTVAALPGIIQGIRQKGLGFSAICYP